MTDLEAMKMALTLVDVLETDSIINEQEAVIEMEIGL